MTIESLKKDMDEQLHAIKEQVTGLSGNVSDLKGDIKEIKELLVGGGLKQDGGMSAELELLKKKVSDLETFKSKTLVIWAVVNASFAAFIALATVAIAYFKK